MALEEIRTVLSQEDMLLPPRDDRTVYMEFAAVYWELQYFAPSMLPRYFPSLNGAGDVDAILAQDLEVSHLYRATRPLGAPDPQDQPVPEELEEWPAVQDEPEDGDPREDRPSERQYHRWMERADRAASAGNLVRAAILRTRAAHVATRKAAMRARTAAKSDLNRLIRRLCEALPIDFQDLRLWQGALIALVERAARGFWTPEGRFLYDLQKVCVDHEREIHTVDVVEWALSMGARPIERALPAQHDILMSKHLRRAGRRLPVVRVTDAQRHDLALLVRAGWERTEERIRVHFRPQIAGVLEEVGLNPRDIPERVARKKLVEELLDQIVERGFLTMGDFRDALSRNNLKLPDFGRMREHRRDEPEDDAALERGDPHAADPFGRQPSWSRPTWAARARSLVARTARRFYGGLAEFFRGDPLLRADVRLADVLDGIYRRGEFYLRWMQQISSLAFGTRAGRLFMRFAAIPFGGAFVALAFLEHVLKDWIGWKDVDVRSDGTVLLFGAFLCGLINLAPFRRGVWRVLLDLYRGWRVVLVDLPLRFLRQPWMQQILKSPPVVLGFGFVVKPAALTLAVCWALPLETLSRTAAREMEMTIFLAVNLLLNSRLGRHVEEVLVDWVVQAWHRFGIRFLMAFLSLVVEVFRSILQAIERFLYAVDEWLRFKSGESRFTLVAKAVLGVAWFFMAYVIRFAITLLIEPQINPIKHFPVVTVSHKLLFPLIGKLGKELIYRLDMETALAFTVAWVIIASIPGIFGFLVWELQENWRLYEANRQGRLGPVRIGEHGETMPRLLKRGFHSGTLPKRYAKLRRAERRARLGGDWRTVRKHLLALHHVERSVRHYVEREFLELFFQSTCWPTTPAQVEEIRLGPSGIRFDLRCPAIPGDSLRITLEARTDWMVGGIVQTGWVDQLKPTEQQVLTAALLGLYKSAGVDLVRQQIEAELPPPAAEYDMDSRGLVVWSDNALEAEAVYDLHQEGMLEPRPDHRHGERPLLLFARAQILFYERPISWWRWVDIWEKDLPQRGHLADDLASLNLVPEKLPRRERTLS